MEETQNGPGNPPQSPPSAPPPASTPPPTTQESPNRTIMLVLSYLGILALIPLLVEKDDSEVQWHAKQGILLLAAWIILFIALTILAWIPVIGAVLGCAGTPLVGLVALVVHIICIVKAVGGERFRVPFVADFADQWK